LPKFSRLTATEAERLLFKAGFTQIRSEGSHRIYLKNTTRVVIPFHLAKNLHPKIIKQVLNAIASE
jgi:predicted RNA binding protein YcfA (HicA-like mRNA interferase family)